MGPEHYAISKGVIKLPMENMAQEFVLKRISANAIAPGRDSEPYQYFPPGRAARARESFDTNLPRPDIPAGRHFVRGRLAGVGRYRHRLGPTMSPAWFLSYQAFEPHYGEAEVLFHVHCQRGEYPSEPPFSGPFSYPTVSHEPRIRALHDNLVSDGLNPFHLPLDTEWTVHELDNVYIADASSFPSIGAVNPTLTIIANALRIAGRIKER